MLNENSAKYDNKIKTCRLLAFILGNFLSIPCFLSAEDMMPYSKFKEININYWKSIQTGTIEAQVSNYELVDQNKMAKQEWESRERIKSKIISDNNLSQKQKNKFIQDIEHRYQEITIPRISHVSDTKKTSKIFTFDLSAGRSRIKEVSSDTNAFGNGISEQIVLTSRDGNQLGYFGQIERANLDKISSRGFNILSSILYLGVLSPEWFENLPKDVNMRKYTMNGRELIVYELSGYPKYPDDKFIIYADPSLGYRYVQLERLSEGKIMRKIVAKNYKEFDETPFPTYYEDTRYSKDGSILEQESIKVEGAHFNQPIEPNSFYISCTPNTIVTAHVDDQIVEFKPSADKNTQKNLEEIEDQAKISPRTKTILIK